MEMYQFIFSISTLYHLSLRGVKSKWLFWLPHQTLILIKLEGSDFPFQLRMMKRFSLTSNFALIYMGFLQVWQTALTMQTLQRAKQSQTMGKLRHSSLLNISGKVSMF